MVLEAVVFPQDVFSYGCKDLYSLAADWSYEFKVEEEEEEEEEKSLISDCKKSGFLDNCQQQVGIGLDCVVGNWDSSSSPSMVHNFKEWDSNSSPEPCTVDGIFKRGFPNAAPEAAVSTMGRRKRRRTRSCKNKEEVENQRMTHIAVERNRRKQMNEYLSVLRSLMPASYVQRGDQASIIGGAINFVKELEQLLHSLEAQKRTESGFSFPFSGFFTFPQYTSCSTNPSSINEMAENRSAIADIEVTMVESHANVKVLSRRRPELLLKMVGGLQNLRLTILHLNVTTVDEMVLYSFSVKVDDNCGLTTVDEIATAVYEMLGRIEEEESMN
ncbi:transcription factor bHLH96-like [Magnolia sinica]|uniref:transcription factor bHLH96-like n=1 Tax=Magnolia sinica TaxID=86752 RepID=UPI00265AF28C|nr:transcription factor bHLH96-like [Magnolia sinica]